MIDVFLKAKHWQLFILIFGIPLISHIIMMFLMISDFNPGANSDPREMFGFMKFIPLIAIIFMIGYFGWLWSIAIGLQKQIPVHARMNPIKFKVLFILMFAYIISFIAGVTLIMNSFNNDTFQDIAMIGRLFWIIIPLHLFSMFCILYSIYFVAKTFKTAELQRPVKFADFAGEFLMIWFYPIGIWIIQPKINKMVNGEMEM